MHKASKGIHGRMSAAPEGQIFVRNPEAARALAIRDSLYLHKKYGTGSKHLRKLSSALTHADGHAIDLVDANTGIKHDDVQITAWSRVGDANKSGVPPR